MALRATEDRSPMVSMVRSATYNQPTKTTTNARSSLASLTWRPTNLAGNHYASVMIAIFAIRPPAFFWAHGFSLPACQLRRATNE
jgi:hypothetical protein